MKNQQKLQNQDLQGWWEQAAQPRRWSSSPLLQSHGIIHTPVTPADGLVQL